LIPIKEKRYWSPVSENGPQVRYLHRETGGRGGKSGRISFDLRVTGGWKTKQGAVWRDGTPHPRKGEEKVRNPHRRRSSPHLKKKKKKKRGARGGVRGG